MEDDREHLKSLGDLDDLGDQGDQDQDQERFQRIFCAVRCCLPAQSRTSAILKKKRKKILAAFNIPADSFLCFDWSQL